MRTVVCAEPGHMTLEQRDPPSCGEGEALLRIRRIGVCGTDIHAYGGNQPYFSYPRVLGHELAGEVVEVGRQDNAELIGKRAYVIPYLHCGECRACRHGRSNCCQRIQVIGVHRDGGKVRSTPWRAPRSIQGPDTCLPLDTTGRWSRAWP